MIFVRMIIILIRQKKIMKYCGLALSALASSVVAKPAEKDFMNDTVPEECFWQDEEIANYIANATVVEKQDLREKLDSGQCPNEEFEHLFKGVGDSCGSCTCFCDARPYEESCLFGTRDSYNANIFMPYGFNAGDAKNTGYYKGQLKFDESFLFYGKEYKEFHYSAHGYSPSKRTNYKHNMELV